MPVWPPGIVRVISVIPHHKVTSDKQHFFNLQKSQNQLFSHFLPISLSQSQKSLDNTEKVQVFKLD